MPELKKGDMVAHPSLMMEVEVERATEFEKHRKIYFKAKGVHGHWVEKKEKT